MRPPRVVGLDLSLTATGVASDSGTTRTIRPAASGDQRLVEIAAETTRWLRNPDLVVIEDVVVRSPAAAKLGMVHGAVRTRLMRIAVPYVLVPPATLKRFAAGKGNADKTAMALALFKRAALELPNDNEVDAYFLRAAGLQLLDAPAFPLPAAQVAALDAVRGDLPKES